MDYLFKYIQLNVLPAANSQLQPIEKSGKIKREVEYKRGNFCGESSQYVSSLQKSNDGVPKRPWGELYKYSQEFAVSNRKGIGIDLNMSKNPKDKAV